MPSASNAKCEKPAPSEGADNSGTRQIMVLVEHKIRNLEKRKSKLTSYRDLQKAGKDLNADQKIAVAKYDEVVQTLDFTRDLFKQITVIANAADRDAKKQAKKDAWVRIAAETGKMRELLIIVDCLTQMGSPEAREDFLKGTNGACKLSEQDLKILDDVYPEVTPKHELDEEGKPAFHSQIIKAAEHLYSIIDGKPKDVLGTTYSHIKEIVMAIYECGYFDKGAEGEQVAVEEAAEVEAPVEDVDSLEDTPEPELVFAPAGPLPVPPAPAVVPAPLYPLCPLPPITLQEVEHAYFARQYPQQRPIAEVIGSQNFVFIQDSEIDSPVGTPQPPPVLNQSSPPSQIPTQTFTNQHYVPMQGARIAPEPTALPIPQPHFAPPQAPHHAAFVAAPPQPPHPAHLATQEQPAPADDAAQPAAPADDNNDDEWCEERSPEREDAAERPRAHGQGDGQNRFRRGGFGRGGRGAPNGYRGRGGYQSRTTGDGYHSRPNDYQNRQNKDGYQSRQNSDGFSTRHKDGYHQNRSNDNYYGNGDSGNGNQHDDNGTSRPRDRYEDNGASRGRDRYEDNGASRGRDRYEDNGASRGRDRYDDNGASRGRDRYDNQSYQGGFKGRGRGAPRGAPRGASRGAPRPHTHQYGGRRNDNAE